MSAVILSTNSANGLDRATMSLLNVFSETLPNLHVALLTDALTKHADDITSMLEQLPDGFKQSAGGGWSFINACMDKDDHQWGEQRSVDQLVMMGIAIGKARFTLPRDIWPVLPGGMPYLVVDA